MAMSERERRLLVTGTLDTSDVGGSPDGRLANVSLAFENEGEGSPAAAEAGSEADTASQSGTSPDAEQDSAAEEKGPAAGAKSAPGKRPAARKTASSKKSQAQGPAEE